MPPSFGGTRAWRQHAKAARLEAATVRSSSRQVLEHAAAERDEREAAGRAQRAADVDDDLRQGVVEARRHDRGGDAGAQVVDHGANQVGAAQAVGQRARPSRVR